MNDSAKESFLQEILPVLFFIVSQMSQITENLTFCLYWLLDLLSQSLNWLC